MGDFKINVKCGGYTPMMQLVRVTIPLLDSQGRGSLREKMAEAALSSV